MRVHKLLIDFMLQEWLLIISGVSLLVTSVYTHNIPYYSINELEVLFILFILFISANGLYRSGFIVKLSLKIKHEKAIALKLILITFFLSMIITNDIALIIIVPLTLSLKIDRQDIIVILEALAANAGSAFTPFGNPQNLYIYWFYKLNLVDFITTIAPFSITFMIILSVSALLIKANCNTHNITEKKSINNFAYIYILLLLITLLTILHLIPILTGLLVIVFALFFDQKALKIDYFLLLNFFFFFGLSENIKILLEPKIIHPEHIFIFSILTSQVISNVPSSILFAKFTQNWEALLWGTNAGGFGSLFGSFANIIAYKIYITHENTNNTITFTGKFLLISYIAFFISIGLYFFIYQT